MEKEEIITGEITTPKDSKIIFSLKSFFEVNFEELNYRGDELSIKKYNLFKNKIYFTIENNKKNILENFVTLTSFLYKADLDTHKISNKLKIWHSSLSYDILITYEKNKKKDIFILKYDKEEEDIEEFEKSGERNRGYVLDRNFRKIFSLSNLENVEKAKGKELSYSLTFLRNDKFLNYCSYFRNRKSGIFYPPPPPHEINDKSKSEVYRKIYQLRIKKLLYQNFIQEEIVKNEEKRECEFFEFCQIAIETVKNSNDARKNNPLFKLKHSTKITEKDVIFEIKNEKHDIGEEIVQIFLKGGPKKLLEEMKNRTGYIFDIDLDNGKFNEREISRILRFSINYEKKSNEYYFTFSPYIKNILYSARFTIKENEIILEDKMMKELENNSEDSKYYPYLTYGGIMDGWTFGDTEYNNDWDILAKRVMIKFEDSEKFILLHEVKNGKGGDHRFYFDEKDKIYYLTFIADFSDKILKVRDVVKEEYTKYIFKESLEEI